MSNDLYLPDSLAKHTLMPGLSMGSEFNLLPEVPLPAALEKRLARSFTASLSSSPIDGDLSESISEEADAPWAFGDDLGLEVQAEVPLDESKDFPQLVHAMWPTHAFFSAPPPSPYIKTEYPSEDESRCSDGSAAGFPDSDKAFPFHHADWKSNSDGALLTKTPKAFPCPVGGCNKSYRYLHLRLDRHLSLQSDDYGVLP